MEAVKEKKINSQKLISIMPLISVLTVAFIKILYRADTVDMLKTSILTLLLTTAVVLYIRLHSCFSNVNYSGIIFSVSYIASILLIMLPKNPQIFSFWMIGGLINAMLIDKILGLLVYFNLTFILYITCFAAPEAIIHYLIMGVLFVLLSDALKNKSTVIYGAIILLSTNITLIFIINNFIFNSNNNTVNYFTSLFSIFAVLAAAFLLSLIYDKFNQDRPQIVHEAIEEMRDEAIHAAEDNTRTSYDVLLSDSNDLLMRIKEHSENLYNHCRKIGDLSGRAAGLIGADEELARAGGYYHEIGKIIGSNYIEEGLKLADEYAFPDKLKNIIRQHNIKYDKPTFKESAIVMITDNVVTTIDYIDKNGAQKIAPKKIIDDIFRMRMEKGTFDESGLTVKEFKILKEFFLNEFTAKNNSGKEDNK